MPNKIKMTPGSEVLWDKAELGEGNLYLAPSHVPDSAEILSKDLSEVEALPVIGRGNRGGVGATVYRFGDYAIRCLPAYRCHGFAEPMAGLEWARANQITKVAVEGFTKPGMLDGLFPGGIKTPKMYGMFLSDEYLLFLMSDCSSGRRHPSSEGRDSRLNRFVNAYCRKAVEEIFPGIRLMVDGALNNVFLGEEDAVKIDVNPEQRLLF